MRNKLIFLYNEVIDALYNDTFKEKFEYTLTEEPPEKIEARYILTGEGVAEQIILAPNGVFSFVIEYEKYEEDEEEIIKNTLYLIKRKGGEA